jgi:hypothetical protein
VLEGKYTFAKYFSKLFVLFISDLLLSWETYKLPTSVMEHHVLPLTWHEWQSGLLSTLMSMLQQLEYDLPVHLSKHLLKVKFL